MKTSAFVWTVQDQIKNGNMKQNDFIPLCAKFGLDGAELFDLFVSGENEEDRLEELRAANTLLNQYGLESPVYTVQNDFTDESEHKANIEIIKKRIDEARILGSRKLRLLGGSTGKLKGRSREEGLNTVLKGLEQAVEQVQGTGLSIVLENHGDLPGTADELLFLLDNIKSPILKICFDMGNFLAANMQVKQDPRKELEKVISHVDHVHAKERRFAPGARGDVESCILGTGDVHFEKCVKMLVESGYNNYICCECEGEKGISTMTSLANSVSNMKTAIERFTI